MSLTEQPSPFYCERKADLWQHINGNELEERDSGSKFCPYHNHLNVLPAANAGRYLTVINGMHAGPLMNVPAPAYGRSQDAAACCTNDSGTVCQSSWNHTRRATVNATYDRDSVMSRPASASVSCRRPSTAALADNKLQHVSRSRFSVFHCVYCVS